MESDIFDALVEGAKSPLWLQNPLQGHFSAQAVSASSPCADGRSPRDIMTRLTPLGVVRFLDHFGDLYGNRLDPTDHEKSDAVLKDVLHAFSTQWMASARFNPSTTTTLNATAEANATGLIDAREVTDLGSSAYLETWYKARSSISQYSCIKSFRVVFSLFVFDMIAMPVQIASPERPQTSEYLDAAIRLLLFLEKKVKAYCKTLGPDSMYADLLQASLDIIRWMAFLRDTTTSIIKSDRKCLYPVSIKSRRGTYITLVLVTSLFHTTFPALADCICSSQNTLKLMNLLA